MNESKVYLDFQAFDIYSKDNEVKSLLNSKCSDYRFYCSTAHLEELYRAICNAKTDDNKQQAHILKESIESLCTLGVLNPGRNTQNYGVELREESIDMCLLRIKEHDTRDAILNVATTLKRAHTQPPSFSSGFHEADEKWKAVWNEKTVIDAINYENSYQAIKSHEKGLYESLVSVYGKDIAAAQINHYLYGCSQRISPNCYSSVKGSYDKLEHIIELLARILSRCGYNRDTTVRTFNSGEYDITHMIYATYCDFFITKDTRLYNRAKAIYYYMDVPTTVLSWAEWISFLKLEERDPA